MRITLKSIVTSALCSGLVATTLSANAWAGPMNVVRSEGMAPPSLTDQIYYRRYRGGYYRPGYNPGAAAAAAAAVGVLGAAAAAGAYAQQPYYYGYPAYGYPAYGYPDGYGW
ncbi:MAG: hypothetical protein CTY36_13335 [Methylocystis sp.]|nr:MAG: hypothetical protein CTY36_13335 [Methylocystis sp.]